MLRSGGDRGREAAGYAPGPEGGRDPPRNLEGTSLRRSLSSVFDMNYRRCLVSLLSRFLVVSPFRHSRQIKSAFLRDWFSAVACTILVVRTIKCVILILSACVQWFT